MTGRARGTVADGQVGEDSDREAIAVALDMSDPEAERVLRVALEAMPVLVVVADETDADVVLCDDVSRAGRRTVVLARTADDVGPGDDGSIVPAAASAEMIRIAIEATHHGLVCRPHTASGVGLHVLGDGGEGAFAADGTAADLTPREFAVLQLMATGAGNKAIARRLGISVHTAKFHVGSVIAKLGAQTRTDAVARAMRSGLLMI